MRARKRTSTGLVALASLLVLGFSAGSAQAAMAPTLHDALASCVEKDAKDNETTTDTVLPYWFCDDGVPMAGGTTPNVGGLSAVTVPAKYGAPPATFDDLPIKAADAATVPGADLAGDIALDVDISLPDAAPPPGGYPIIFMMHGCCSGNKTNWEAPTVDTAGERWHYNNAWFAARGYVVVTYTSRGFVGAQPTNRGSTGETQLNSRSFEINDFQALACNVFDNFASGSFDDVNSQNAEVDPAKIVATGGSYGGGFAWLAATDPTWNCTADTGATGQPMSLAAAAPRYGWTDLAYTLVPNGTHLVRETDPLTNTQGCADGPLDLDGMSTCTPPLSPVGVAKRSIVGLLYATGNSASDHTTFPSSIHSDFACLTSTYPAEGNPLCTDTLSTSLPEFMRERSAYYQNHWFTDIATQMAQRVPIYNAGTFSDPLFPSYENRRMVRRIRAEVAPDTYPIKQYYGDYQHFVQNKAKEWGDLCGPDRHVCTFADYPAGDLNADPSNLVPGPAGTGVTTRLNKFIDNYALPTGGFGAVPANVTPEITASLQVCETGNTEAGERITTTSSNFDTLTPGTLTVDITASQVTTSTVPGNSHATTAEPFGNLLFNGGRCPFHAGPNSVAPEAGVASYTSDALAAPGWTMIGSTRVTIDFELTGGTTDGLQLNARLYDVAPDGSAKMVDRGPRRITPEEVTAGQVVFDLHGNGWRFLTGHRVRVELAQDDEPFVKRTDVPSSLTLSHVNLAIPTVEAGTTIGGTADPKTPPAGNPTTPAASSPAATTPKPKKCKKKKKKGKKGVAAAKCKKKKK